MEQPEAVEFSGSDTTYQQWLSQHSSGFVINTERTKKPGYMVLHTTQCKHISQYKTMALTGGFTERLYVKICADNIDSLRAWTKQNGRPDGSFSSECSHCKPIAL